jgi:hypothetical protein
LPGVENAKQVSYGFDVTLLIDICNAIIKAESAGKLNKRYERLAKQAHIVVSANVIVEMENGKPVHAYEAKIKERFGRQKEFEFMIPAQAGPVVIEVPRSADDPFKPLH